MARTEQYIENLLKDKRQTAPRPNVALFLNSLHQTLAKIQSCGIGAVAERRETGEKIVLTITIPK